jgi:hypothetical protein
MSWKAQRRPSHIHEASRPGYTGQGTYLVIHGVPLRDKHAVNATAPPRRSTREVAQRTIEFGQLINCFVTYQGLSNEYDLVRVVDCYKLRECRQPNLDEDGGDLPWPKPSSTAGMRCEL